MGKGITGNSILKILAIFLSLVIVVSAGLIVINIWDKNRTNLNGDDFTSVSNTVEYNGAEYSLKKNIETFLVLGLDKTEDNGVDSYNNNKQADFLLLLVIDNNTSQYNAIHINRDTMVDMDILGVSGDKVGVETGQIALSHTYGNGKEVSCGNTAKSVSNLLMGIKIDHYISVTMDAVPVFNDFVGGVEVEVLDDFTGVDDTLVKGQTIKLNGNQAFNYVRTRYGLEDSSNSTRMIRQRQYIKSLHNTVMELMEKDSNFVSSAALKLSGYTVSDCNTARLETLFEKISDYKFGEIVDLKGQNKMGETFIEFYPDKENLKQTVIKYFYDEK